MMGGTNNGGRVGRGINLDGNKWRGVNDGGGGILKSQHLNLCIK